MGAVMILVGYVCAVRPNLVLSRKSRGFWYFIPFFICLLGGNRREFHFSKSGSMGDYFLRE
jgi:hypothetical protein